MWLWLPQNLTDATVNEVVLNNEQPIHQAKWDYVQKCLNETITQISSPLESQQPNPSSMTDVTTCNPQEWDRT